MPFKKIKALCLTVTAVLASIQLRAQAPGFVQEDVIKVAGVTTNTQVNALTLGNIQTTRVYIDGLGRAIQSVALQASPVNNKDIVQPMVYNTLGQQTTGYLPYTDNSTVNPTGSFRTTAVTDQLTYYQNSGTTTNPNKVANETTSPFSQQVFENSPLQRVLSAGMVGTGFQPVSGQHYKTVVYRLNNSTQDGNVIEWSSIGVYTSMPNYGDNTLSVTDGTDEDGVETRAYTDNMGRTVLKRQLLGSAYLDTYYVYNVGGAVAYIIPPTALAKMVASSDYNPTDAPVNTMVFAFTYDYLGRLIEKTVPAKGKMSIVYDPLNRPVLMQDALMNSNNQWNYIRYDAEGRAISQGIYTDSNAGRLGRSAMQTYVTGLASTYNTTYFETRNTASSTGYYTATVFPTSTTGTLTPLAYAYFDDYKLNPSGTAYSYATQGITGEETATTAPVKGMPTMVRKTTVSSGSSLSGYWLLNVTFFDKRLHPIQTQSNNQLNYTLDVLTDNSTGAPDFMGAPLVSFTKKVTGTGTANTVTVLTNITYDYMYRVSAVDQSYNSGTLTRIGAYAYNEMGQLVTKNLGQVATGTIPATLSLSSYSATTAVATSSITLNPGFTVSSGSNFHAFISTGYLQTLDLRYNIRGQLTTMNNSTLSNDNGLTNSDNTDIFGMTLLYDQVDANVGNTASYDGKISAVKWMSTDASGIHSNERSYKYSYDPLNRYTGATYGERAGGSSGSFSTNSGGFNESITYDIGGSIQSLYRNAILTTGGSAVEIDHLTYGYSTSNPNQLNSISETNDANHNAAGFRYIAATSGSYSYDVNGSLTADPYKGITSIAYNYLNKTDKITLSGTQYINYIYDGAGTLIRKQQTSGSTVTTTDYIDGFVYNNTSGTETLAYFAMPEGRVMNNGGTLVDEYIIGDQQGNARLSFQNNNGVAVVKQENSYYPTGLIMPNSPVATPSAPNKNLYNGGSEWQNDFGNLPDYYETYFRNYDAAIARWVAVDPVAESAESLTPYQYVGNNPVMYNDPLGDKLLPAPPTDPTPPPPGWFINIPMVGGGDEFADTWAAADASLDAMNPNSPEKQQQQYEDDLMGFNGPGAQKAANDARTIAAMTPGRGPTAQLAALINSGAGGLTWDPRGGGKLADKDAWVAAGGDPNNPRATGNVQYYAGAWVGSVNMGWNGPMDCVFQSLAFATGRDVMEIQQAYSDFLNKKLDAKGMPSAFHTNKFEVGYEGVSFGYVDEFLGNYGYYPGYSSIGAYNHSTLGDVGILLLDFGRGGHAVDITGMADPTHYNYYDPQNDLRGTININDSSIYGAYGHK